MGTGIKKTQAQGIIDCISCEINPGHKDKSDLKSQAQTLAEITAAKINEEQRTLAKLGRLEALFRELAAGAELGA